MIATVVWLIGMGLHGIVILYIVKELRWRFRFPAWQYAWAYLLVAVTFIAIRRTLSFFAILSDLKWLDAIDAPFVSCFFALGFQKLSGIFHQELPALLIPTARVSIDSNSVIVEWDAQATTLFGFTAEEAIGATLMQTIMPSRDWEAHRDAVAKFLNFGEPGRVLSRTFATNAHCKNDQEIAVEITVSAIMSAIREDVRFHASIRRLIPF